VPIPKTKRSAAQAEFEYDIEGAANLKANELVNQIRRSTVPKNLTTDTVRSSAPVFLQPAIMRHLDHADRPDCICHRLAFSHRRIELPQLCDNLFRLVSSP
jgi:hypothetical protein